MTNSGIPVFKARRALVTGAGRGIGKQIAIEFAKAGYHLGLTARTVRELATTEAAVRSFGVDAVSIAGDVTRPLDVRKVCRIVEKRIGPIDVLVNNAGVYGEPRSFVGSDMDRWWRVVETNLRGPALFCQYVLPGMIERASGHIVNINSRLATENLVKSSGSAYGVSKAALRRLTSALAAETAGTGVVIVDFSPGMVRTAMTEQHPGCERLPDAMFTPVSAAAKKVTTLVSGNYRRLHGTFVHVKDDLDMLPRLVSVESESRAFPRSS